jgi:putative hydrolase of the HAD superfamily
MSKPDLRIYALTCERLGVRPDETVFIDDYAPNVVAAGEAGLHGVHHTVNATTIGEIERLLLRTCRTRRHR